VGCDNDSTTATIKLRGDGSPSAQWFVCVGVLAFLFSLASIVYYVAFEATYRAVNERLVTIGDLVATSLFAFFWLTAASAWASALNAIVKPYATFQCVADPNCGGEDSQLIADSCSSADNKCTDGEIINFSKLNISVTFGFLNFFLWACNIWFVYKETPFHVQPAKENYQPDAQAQVPPSNI
jgi:hypothetical protein